MFLKHKKVSVVAAREVGSKIKGPWGEMKGLIGYCNDFGFTVLLGNFLKRSLYTIWAA